MNGKVDYSIEYGHVFADAPQASRAHKQSIEETKKFIRKLRHEKKTYALTMIIDNYLPAYSYLNFYRYVNYFKTNKVPPDYVAYESQLLKVARTLMCELPKNRLRKEIREVKLKSNKDLLLLDNKTLSTITLREDVRAHIDSFVDTPLLIAAFFLMKLGHISSEGIVTPTNYLKPKPFVGKKTITIDPKAFKGVNDKALKIISMTKYNDAAKDMEFIYF
ncbi:MAG: hypothetical protein KAJ24_06830 [Candidatus Aenigmarchaeota archaeon]|nr:hypothetical protein [Candidatus Aenigmarchaeota archaeon]